QVGSWMLGRFEELQEKYEFIGHVQGKGLMIGVELVKDRLTREPLDRKTCGRIFQACVKRGLISMVYAPHFRVNPARSIDRNAADTALGILDEAFAQIEQEGHWR